MVLTFDPATQRLPFSNPTLAGLSVAQPVSQHYKHYQYE